MKKKILAGIIAMQAVLGVLLFVNLANAQTVSNNPFRELWQAISKLEHEIANIQLIPGPQGPAGPDHRGPGPGIPLWPV